MANEIVPLQFALTISSQNWCGACIMQMPTDGHPTHKMQLIGVILLQVCALLLALGGSRDSKEGLTRDRIMSHFHGFSQDIVMPVADEFGGRRNTSTGAVTYYANSIKYDGVSGMEAHRDEASAVFCFAPSRHISHGLEDELWLFARRQLALCPLERMRMR